MMSAKNAAAASLVLALTSCSQGSEQHASTRTTGSRAESLLSFVNDAFASPHALPAAGAIQYRTEGAHLVAVQEPEPHATTLQSTRRPARVLLPRKADEPFVLTDVLSGLSIEVSLAGARASVAEPARGYVVYPDALGRGVFHRVHPEGTEDLGPPMVRPFHVLRGRVRGAQRQEHARRLGAGALV